MNKQGVTPGKKEDMKKKFFEFPVVQCMNVLKVTFVSVLLLYS